MEQWEYKILELSTELYVLGTPTEGTNSDIGTEAVRFREIERKEEVGFFGGKKEKRIASTLTTEKIEIIFNKLGKQGWILCETVPLITSTIHVFKSGSRTTSVQFIFKRKKE